MAVCASTLCGRTNRQVRNKGHHKGVLIGLGFASRRVFEMDNIEWGWNINGSAFLVAKIAFAESHWLYMHVEESHNMLE
eukprot:66097-Amphidinium_carterae.1